MWCDNYNNNNNNNNIKLEFSFALMYANCNSFDFQVVVYRYTCVYLCREIVAAIVVVELNYDKIFILSSIEMAVVCTGK